MATKPTYAELECRVAKLQKKALKLEQAEAALKKSEERYRSLVEKQSDLVSRFKPDGTFTYVNEAYCRFFGKTRQQLIGKKWHPLPVDADLRFILKKLAQLTPLNPSVIINNRVQSFQKDVHWMQFANTGFFDDDGHLTEIQSVGRDVTDLRLAQKESTRLAQEWQNTFDANYDAVWILDREQRVARSNKTAEILFGRSNEEMIGKHCWTIVHGTDAPIPGCPGVRARQSLHRESMEFQFGHRWFQVTADPILDESGDYSSAVHIIRDITVQKLTEIELKRTLAATTDGIWSWNFKTNQFFFSPKYYEMLGYAANEFPADYKHWVNLIHPDDREMAIATASEFLETKPDRYENQFRLRTRNGEYRYIRARATVVERDKDGNAVYMIGNHEDITKRRQVEIALLESREWFRGIFEQSPIAIEIHDAEGRLKEANPQCLKLFGISNLDAVKGFKLFDDPNLPHGAKANLLKGIPIHYEHPFDFDIIKDKDIYETTRAGKIFLNVHISPLFFSDNRLSGYLVQVEEITERKRAEENRNKLQDQLLHSQKMEAIATLTGGIAHDYNNLLAVIIGNLSLMTDQAESVDPELIAHIEDVSQAALKARDLTHELMMLSKGGAVIKKNGSIRQLITSAVAGIPTKYGIVIQKVFAEDLLQTPYDIHKMGMVLKNLVANAVEAMPEGGTVTIRAQNFKLEDNHDATGVILPPGNYVRIAIEDSGCGIAGKNLNKVFDPYFSTKPKGVQKGMGLGLTTAHAIVQKHGGTLTIESTPGAGTTAVIYLSAEKIQSKKAQIETAVQKSSPFSTKRLLIMDDEAMLRKMAQQMLIRLGYKVSTVKDGGEAIRIFKEGINSENPFDAVILDLTIKGGMGGEQAIQELLKIDPDVKALLCSGYSNDSVMTNFQKHGFMGAITKPFEKGNLKEALENLFKQR